MVAAYQAKQGDIIWMDFDPQTGHEQKGRRPALVVTNNTFNRLEKRTAMVCPIRSVVKNMPLHLELDERTKTKGAILCDQAKVLDYVNRNASFIERLPDDILQNAIAVIIGSLETEE